MVMNFDKRRQRAALNIELVTALGVLMTAMIPIAYSFVSEMKLARSYYHDAIAAQLIDGETEMLVRGESKAYADGEHILKLTGAAATNLPPGKCVLTRAGKIIRVEWRPEKHGRRIVREVTSP